MEDIKDVNGTELQEDAENEKPEKVYDDITKWNSKIVTPVIVLSATLFMAVYTYFKHYPVGVWIRILIVCVLIFLTLGTIIERMFAKFVDINYEKAVAIRREEERIAEEKAREEAEAEARAQMGPEIISDQDETSL